jgi:hypothetical protein
LDEHGAGALDRLMLAEVGGPAHIHAAVVDKDLRADRERLPRDFAARSYAVFAATPRLRSGCA